MAILSKRLTNVFLFVVLVLAGGLRFAYPAWDDGYHTHPDERYIYWVATSIEVPQSVVSFFAPELNALNPYRWTTQPQAKGMALPAPSIRQFTYGHLPLYLLVFGTRLLNALGQLIPLNLPLISDLLNVPHRAEYDHLPYVGRALSALFDLLSVCLIYLIGRRLFDETIALSAAAFTALAVIHLQQAHFGTFDVPLTTFTLLALYFAIRYTQATQRWDLILAGVSCGFAIASKASGAMLLLPLGATLLIKRAKIQDWILFPLITFLIFALTNPFAFVEFEAFITQLTFQSDMARGEIILPYTHQYIDTLPFLYVIEQQAKWLLGLPLTIAIYLGLAFWIFTLFHSLSSGSRSSLFVILAFLIPFYIFQATLMVKYPRYLLPVTPLLILAGAWLLVTVARRWQVAWSLWAITLSYSLISAFAFISMYANPHPWVVVTEWLYRTAPAKSVLLLEHWDADLPLRLPNTDTQKFVRLEIDSFGAPDSPKKLEALVQKLAASDYFLVASNRVYGVVLKPNTRYPLSQKFYAALFTGRLGFALAAQQRRPPLVFGWAMLDDPFAQLTIPMLPPTLFNLGFADESFTLYDHPLALVWQNIKHLSAAQIWALLGV